MNERNNPAGPDQPTAEQARAAWLLQWPWWGLTRFMLGLAFFVLGTGNLIVSLVTVWPDLTDTVLESVILRFCVTLLLACTTSMLGQKATAQDGVWTKRGIVAFCIGFTLSLLNAAIPAYYKGQQAVSDLADQQWSDVAVGQKISLCRFRRRGKLSRIRNFPGTFT